MVARTNEERAIDPSPLEASGLPTFFRIADAGALGLTAPLVRQGAAVRVHAHSLNAMQKEAIVYSTQTRDAWRLASDEGAYLNGHDVAPCPLAFMTTGMVAAILDEIEALATQREIALDDIELIQHNYYTMEGSALHGTMTGGALPVELTARIASDADDATLGRLVTDAVHFSPLNGLVRHRQRSLFSLTLNGEPTPLGRAHPVCATCTAADPNGAFALAAPAAADKVALVERLETAGTDDGAGSSLKDTQSRRLHLEAVCRRRDDGLRSVEVRLHSPVGSTFRFVCAAPSAAGAAPDALSYAAAGLAFCFMTQLGRYAAILKRPLTGYKLVQDMRFSPGGGTGATARPGESDPVESHVFLEMGDSAEFARACVDIGEQTCFLHALCRTPLGTDVTVQRLASPAAADAVADADADAPADAAD